MFLLTSSKNGRNSFLDEETILFVSNRDKKDSVLPKTVYQKISLHGCEATEAFRLPFHTSSLKPLGNGKFLIVSIHDLSLPEDKEETKKYIKENKDYKVFDELPFWFNGAGIINKKRTRLYLYDDVSKKTSLLTIEYFYLMFSSWILVLKRLFSWEIDLKPWIHKNPACISWTWKLCIWMKLTYIRNTVSFLRNLRMIQSYMSF